MKILGIDFGTKRVGLAIGDSELRVAAGLGVIEYKGQKAFIEQLHDVVKDEQIGLVVIGLPRNMNGSEGKGAETTRRIAGLIGTGLNVNVEFVDERLTTMQATRQLHLGDGKVGKSKGKIDMMSAILILQTYLDRLQARS